MMPPRKKRTSSLEKVMAQAMALLEKHGVDTEKIEKPEAPATNFRNGDAVVVFANVPKHFVPGVCRNCGRAFAHNQPIRVGSRVGFCSDPCRWENWRKTTGLPYSAVSVHDVWEGNPPMIITPDQLDNLKAIAKWVTENLAILEQRLESPEVESFPVVVDPDIMDNQKYLVPATDEDPFADIFD